MGDLHVAESTELPWALVTAEKKVEHLQLELEAANVLAQGLTDRVHELIVERGRMIDTISLLRTQLGTCQLKLELKSAGLLTDDEV